MLQDSYTKYYPARCATARRNTRYTACRRDSSTTEEARSSFLARPHRRRRRHLRRPNPAHDDGDKQAGGGPAPRRVLAAVAARAPGIQRASTDARRVQLGRAECDERYPVRWKEVLLPIAA